MFWTELFHLNVSSISSDTYLSYTIHTNAAAPSPSHSGLLTSTEWNFYVRFVLFLASPPTPNGKIKLRLGQANNVLENGNHDGYVDMTSKMQNEKIETKVG